MKKTTLDKCAKLLGTSLPLKLPIEKFCFDSRTVVPGSLFFALMGERHNGHDYLEEVARKGAIAAVVSKGYVGSNFGLPLLYVEDPVAALQALAKKFLQENPVKIIGITGSVGKTTTKEFIYGLIKDSFSVYKNPDSFNSQRGLPLAMLNRRGDEDWILLEMAMSEKGNISKLVSIAPPSIAVVTNITLQHAAFFNSLNEIAAAKAEILSSPLLEKVILGEDVEAFDVFKECTNLKVTYGLGKEADFCFQSGEGEVFVIEKGEGSHKISLPFRGEHLQENFIAAAAVARSLGVSWEEIGKRAASLKPYKRRFESLWINDVHVINDTYNASPLSVSMALKNLPKPAEGGKSIAVLGELKELGKFTSEMYKKISEEAIGVVDHLLCYGKETEPYLEAFKKESKPAELFLDKAELKKRLFSLMKPGDVVLIKGANSNSLWELIEN